MLYLRIIDETGKTLELEELTQTGRGMVCLDAKVLLERLDELENEEVEP